MVILIQLLLDALFVALLSWSVYPFSGETLPHIVEHAAGWSFNMAAIIIALACGLTALLKIFIHIKFTKRKEQL